MWMSSTKARRAEEVEVEEVVEVVLGDVVVPVLEWMVMRIPTMSWSGTSSFSAAVAKVRGRRR